MECKCNVDCKLWLNGKLTKAGIVILNVIVIQDGVKWKPVSAMLLVGFNVSIPMVVITNMYTIYKIVYASNSYSYQLSTLFVSTPCIGHWPCIVQWRRGFVRQEQRTVRTEPRVLSDLLLSRSQVGPDAYAPLETISSAVCRPALICIPRRNIKLRHTSGGRRRM